MFHFNNYISPEQMDAVMLVTKVIASIFIAFFLASLIRMNSKEKVKRKYDSVKRKRHEKYMESPEKKFAYDSIEEKMWAYGIKFRLGNSFSLFDYTVLRTGLSLVVAILSAFLSPWYMPIAFVIVFGFIPIYFKEQDSNDNEEMMSDIGRMNSITALQIKNGVYISKVIYECYRTVENPRLKQALLELSIDIENFASIEQAARQFRRKFNNQHIDTYAKVLEQIEESGKSLDFFDDIASSVDRINEAIAIIEEQKADRISSFFQLILFLGPLIIVFYILAGSFSGNGLW